LRVLTFASASEEVEMALVNSSDLTRANVRKGDD